MINKLLIIFILPLSICAQDLIFTENYRFIGYYEGKPIFHLYGNNPRIDKKAIYTLEKKDNLFGFSMISNEESFDNTIFIQNEITIEGLWNTDKEGYDIKIKTQNNLVFEVFMKYSPRVTYSQKHNTLFLFVRNEPRKEQVLLIDFEKVPYSPIYLPIKGYNGYVISDWLYFSFYHENYDYSPYPDDIFRVRIGDWYNPELLIECVEPREWFVFPENQVFYANVSLGEEKKGIDILYSVINKKYMEIPFQGFNTPAYVKYQGQYFYYKTIKDNTRGIRTIDLQPLPELPESFPYQDTRKVLPREVWYNVLLS